MMGTLADGMQPTPLYMAVPIIDDNDNNTMYYCNVKQC